MKIKLEIGSKSKENLERILGFAKMAVGTYPLKGFTHFYGDEEKWISVENRKNKVRVTVFYRSGNNEKESYLIPYSKLE